jgi:TolA-binding protein
MKKTIQTIGLTFMCLFMSSCQFVDYIESKAASINNYERVALNLSKENRTLQTKMSSLEFEIQSLKSRNQFLELKLQEKSNKVKREIASIIPRLPKKNFVKNEIYHWSSDQLLATAEKEFSSKNFEKSAQFYHAISINYKSPSILTDRYHFEAGIAAYESNNHDDWTIYHLNSLVSKYPSSKFYRGAKLWMALANLRQGNQKAFFTTVDEFRKKYKNTQEWDILKGHYETIVQKYK